MNIFGGEKSRLANFQNMAGSGIQRQSTIYKKDQKDVLADKIVVPGTAIINYNINYAPLTILHIQYMQIKPVAAMGIFFAIHNSSANRILCYIDALYRPVFHVEMGGVVVFNATGTADLIYPCYYAVLLTINSSGSVILANCVKIRKNAIINNPLSGGIAFTSVRAVTHTIQAYTASEALPGQIIQHDVIQKFTVGITPALLLKHAYEKIGGVSLHL